MSADKLDLALIACIVIAICVIVAFSLSSEVMAQGTLDYIHIVAQDTDISVSSIAFPQGSPGGNVTAPYNDVNGSGSPQFVAAESSVPVVRLKNTHSSSLIVWLQITDWTNGVAVAEYYELVDTGNTTVQEVKDVLSADGGAATVNTGVEIDAGAYKALYLAVTLGDESGKSGTSTLTILGEVPPP